MREQTSAAYLSLRHSTQSLDQFEPLFDPISLLNLVQPRHRQLHNGLNGAFQLAMFFAQDGYTRVELRIISRVVLELYDGLNESRR